MPLSHLLKALEHFSWDVLEEEWQKNFRELKEFKNEHGHASPQRKKTTLGRWCEIQRTNKNKGKLSTLG